MLRAIPLLALSVLLLGCQSADARFDRSFEVANTGSERCVVAKEARQYFIQQGDEKGLDKWRSKGAYDCASAGF